MGYILSGERETDTDTLMERAAQAASGFENLGIGAGDTVALYLRNDFPFMEAAVGAGMLGAYSTPVNWHYTVDEARYLFENSEAKAIVIHADLLNGVREAVPASVPVFVVPTPPEIRDAYSIDPETCAVAKGDTDWYDWLDRFEPRTEPPAEAPGSMIYTSGTTGHPKGVRRMPPTPEQVEATNRVLSKVFGFDRWAERPDQIVTAVTGPMYHSAPNAYGLAAFRMGANVILQPRFDSEELLRFIQDKKVTHLHMVPTMFVRLLKLPEETKQKYDLSSLDFVVHAAAPCPVHVKQEMIEWWGPVINEYYGGTETGAVVFCDSDEWLAHPGTVGKPVDSATVMVIDEDEKELERGATGEIVCRIADISDFTYHRDDEKRARAEKKGLISLGDVGYIDEDGFLYLCDRAKDMVISGGVNIYPAEIEAELHKMPGVADCAVFGIPHDEYGEALCAVVQRQPGSDIGEGDVTAFLRKHVAGYKVPRTIEFRTDLPREDSGKIFKRKLREPYWEAAGRQI